MARFAPGGPPEGRSLLSLLRAFVALVLTLTVLTAILYSGYLRYTDLGGAQVTAPTASLEVDRSGRKVTCGRSSLTRERDLWLLRLEGSPEEIGDAQGQLVSLESQLGNLQRSAAQSDARAVALEGQLNAVRAELADAQNTIARLEAQLRQGGGGGGGGGGDGPTAGPAQ